MQTLLKSKTTKELKEWLFINSRRLGCSRITNDIMAEIISRESFDKSTDTQIVKKINIDNQ